MSKAKQELLIYHNQVLMNQTNDLFIRIKTHLFDLGDEKFKERHPIPTREELDLIMNRIIQELRKDCEPMRK